MTQKRAAVRPQIFAEVCMDKRMVRIHANAKARDELKQLDTPDAPTLRFGDPLLPIERHIINLLRGNWEYIQPHQIGALTQAPILALCPVWDEIGCLSNYDVLCWFPAYEFMDWAEVLYKQGVVYLTMV